MTNLRTYTVPLSDLIRQFILLNALSVKEESPNQGRRWHEPRRRSHKTKKRHQNDASPCDLYRSGCCRIRNLFIMRRKPAWYGVLFASQWSCPWKKKPASQKTPASMICTAAHAVGYEISLSCGESRRDMVFYATASGVAHGKKSRHPKRHQPLWFVPQRMLSDTKLVCHASYDVMA